MKKNIATIILTGFVFHLFAQNNAVLFRSDTTILNASECNWSISSEKPTPDSNKKNNLGKIILDAVKENKLKALDSYNGKLIPASEIYTWKMGADTISYYDSKTETTKYKITKKYIDTSEITRIKIQQNWYLNKKNGKIFSQIKWIEPMRELYRSDGTMLGYVSICRVYY
jgi:hypothetical protein